jgi:tetratricopeptide (TPR) repeat protein
MAVAEKTTPSPAPSADWKKRESLSSALLQIAIVGVLLAGGVFFVYHRGTTKKNTREGVDNARTLALRDNPKDLNASLAVTEKLLTENANLAEAHAIAADLYSELWMVHRVPGADAKAKEHLAAAEQGDARIEERYSTKAMMLISDGKPAEAEQYVDEVRKMGRSSARIWHALARAYQDNGTLDLARQAYAQAMDKAWKDPRFSAAFGDALLSEGRYPQAVEMVGKGLAVNPDHLQSRLVLSLAQVRKREHVKDASDTVTELLGREAELTPGLKARALTVKAELAIFDQKLDDALKLANEALAVNATDEYALLAKARALALKKDPAALDAFKAAIARRQTAPLFYMDGAAMLQEGGNPAGALALLDAYEARFKDVKLPAAEGKVLNALDRDDRFWIARGDVLKGQGKLDEAMVSYDKAVAAGSVNLVKAHHAKAMVYLQRNEQDKALESLQLIAPPDGKGGLPDAYVSMGELLFAKKQFAEGCQQFAYALSGFRAQQAPREKMNNVLDNVHKKLLAANQKPMAKMWLDEAKPIIQ